MENKDIFDLFKKKVNRRNFLAIVGLFLIGATLVTVFTPIQYKSSAKVLISQRFGRNTDIYSAARFTDYLTNLLREVIYSKVFFDEVMKGDFNIDNDFSSDEIKRAKQWENTIETRVLSDTGVLKLDAFDKDRQQAENLVRGVATILLTKSDQFHGAGDQVLVRVIDGPVTTNTFVRPNIILNISLGLFLGIIVGLLFVFLFPDFGNTRKRSHKTMDIEQPRFQ